MTKIPASKIEVLANKQKLLQDLDKLKESLKFFENEDPNSPLVQSAKGLIFRLEKFLLVM